MDPPFPLPLPITSDRLIVQRSSRVEIFVRLKVQQAVRDDFNDEVLGRERDPYVEIVWDGAHEAFDGFDMVVCLIAHLYDQQLPRA